MRLMKLRTLFRVVIFAIAISAICRVAPTADCICTSARRVHPLPLKLKKTTSYVWSNVTNLQAQATTLL